MALGVLDAFTMPTPVKITGRTSTITNSFVNSIIPVVMPAESEVATVLKLLGTSADDLRCSYCGDPATEWDHLRPLVAAKRPTGYISEIANLVPACGKCNQSKGGQPWRDWIRGTAKLSPASRRVPDLEERISRLEAFERWREPTKVDFESAAGSALWAEYWERHQRLLTVMRECQSSADAVRATVQKALSVPRKSV